MQKKLLFSFLLFILFFSFACNLLTVDDKPGDYPTTFPEVDFEELQLMNQEYQAANENYICSTLNEFGFTGFSEIFFIDGESPCAGREIVRIEMNETDTLESLAKKVLLKNSTYTGVEDTSALHLKKMVPLNGCTICEGPDVNSVPIEWKLTFSEQQVDTVRVIGTEITVFLDAYGVNRIWGNWYPEFEKPEFIKFGYLDVMEGLVALQIDMRKYTNEEFIYSVKEEDMQSTPRYVYKPYISGKGLEIRTCWEIPINYESKNFNGWFAYVDIEEGFIVDLMGI